MNCLLLAITRADTLNLYPCDGTAFRVNSIALEVLQEAGRSSSPEKFLMTTVTSLNEEMPYGEESSKRLSSFLMQQLSFKLQRGEIKHRHTRRKVDEFLHQHGYRNPKKPSLVTKVVQRLRGNHSGEYIWTRLKDHVEFSLNTLKKDPLKLIILLLLFACSLFLFFKKKRGGWLLLLLLLTILFIPETSRSAYNKRVAEKYFRDREYRFFEEKIGVPLPLTPSDKISRSPHRFFLPIYSGEKNTKVGDMALFPKEDILVSICTDTVSSSRKIMEVDEAPSTVLVATGAYLDLQKVPIGYSIMDGKVINSNFSLFDALLISTGSLFQVVNLSISNSLNGTTPRSFPEYLQLMKLADRENCQAIQLPLMAWNNSYLVDISGAAYQLRETRFLLELSNEQGQGFWAVADCRVPDFLPNVSYSLFTLLQHSGYFVHSMVLLDTGFFNYLKVRDYSGNPQTQFSKEWFEHSIRFVSSVICFKKRDEK